MPAATTDKFVKGARKLAGTIDASGISDAIVDNFGLSSVAGLPTDTAVEIVVDRVDSNGTKTPAKEEVIRGIVSASRIINAVRGVEGTAQSHAAGAVWEVRLTASMWNRLIDGLLVSLTQAGKLLLSALDGVRYAADAGGDDAYEVTLDPVPSAYYAGMEVNFKPTTANTGACTLNVNGLGAKTIKKNVSSDLSTGDILAGQMVKVMYDGTNFQLVSTIPASALNAPQGFLINGKISVTDSGSGLVVAIKTLAGTDPSASDPVYCRIGDTVRSITAALSVTAADGTNWFHSGGTELATQEADYFVYLGYNATDGVVLGFSRYADGKQYGDFNTTSTDRKYCKISTITNAASTDYYEAIGRFAATLSAGAGYTWSVPTFTPANLIQRPIYKSRWLTWVPAWTGYSSPPSVVCKYRIDGGRCWLDMRLISTGTSNATSNKFSVPFTQVMPTEGRVCVGWGVNNGANLSNVPRLEFDGSADFNFQLDGAGSSWTSSGAKYVGVIGFSYEI